MKILIAVALALVACTQEQEAQPRAQPLTVQQVAPPPQPQVQAISGVVTAQNQGALSLDSGGEQPIPLKITDKTSVTVDGKPATAGDIREGDVVRAAYRMSSEGEPLALKVVVNSKSVTAVRPQAEAPAAPAPARE